MTRTPAPRHLVVLLVTLLVLAACSGTPPALPDAPLPAAFDSGVPAPTEEVVLTVTVGGESHDWDLPTLGLLEQHDLTILEPFVDEEHTYTGPLWADVLRASGTDLAAADSAELVALDDYVADIPVGAETLDGLLLARLEDGDPIPIEAGGPIRLVFPPDNPAADNTNNWIWSLRHATVD